MKLRQLSIAVVVTVISVLAVFAGYVGSERQQRKADQYLAEAKQVLAEDLGVQPEELTMYWSGEYEGNNRYRYRYYPSTSSGDASYSPTVRSIQPDCTDAVIKNTEARELLAKSVNHYVNRESWDGVMFVAAVTAIIAAAIALCLAIWCLFVKLCEWFFT